MLDDPIITEVRRVRDELAHRFNYDVKALCEDLMRRQGKTVTLAELRAGAGAALPSSARRTARSRHRPGTRPGARAEQRAARA